MHIWINFEESDPLGSKFEQIKKELGLHSRAEVIRHLIKKYRLVPKKEAHEDGN